MLPRPPAAGTLGGGRRAGAVTPLADRATLGRPSAEEATVHIALTHDVLPDYLTRRAPLRDEHLALAERFRDASATTLPSAPRPGSMTRRPSTCSGARR